jgi:hypothetical protein
MKKERFARSLCVRTGKRKYDSYWEARAAAQDIKNSLDEDHGRPYRCAECGGWHLGRSSFA